jgi:uncharacterized phage protein (TIGR02220 family)
MFTGLFYFPIAMNKSRVHNPKYLEKYFTQFPNIIDDSDLSPFEYRLLLHYYRVGECWEGVRKTAEICKMSVGKVSECRKNLQDKGFIKIIERGEGIIIYLVDVSSENIKKYSNEKLSIESVHVVNDSVHVVSDTCSGDEPKKNQFKKNQEEEHIHDFSKLIIDKLNQFKKDHGVRGKSIWTLERAKSINARLKAHDFTLEQVIKMLQHRCGVWKNTEWERYLTPETLFRPSKFTGYMEQSIAQPEKGWEQSGIEPDNSQPLNDGMPSNFTW